MALLKLPGVESAEVSLDKASADIRLKPDNHVTMAQLRALLKKNGYPTRDAQIEARGKLADASGKLVFDLLNGSTMDVVSDATSIRALQAMQPLTLTGVSRADAKGVDKLAVTAVH